MDNRFGRYTTPTHTFTVPLDTSKITLLSIAYEQRGLWWWKSGWRTQ